jgi:carboxyl-terminal processing protease
MPSQLTSADKIYGLSLIWREAFYNFAFFERLPNLNWNQTFREYLPLVAAAEELYSYYRVLASFTARLQDGHTGIFFPKTVLDQNVVFPAAALQEVAGHAVVIAVDRSLQERLPLGSRLIAVDGMPVDERLNSEVIPYVFASSDTVRRHLAIRGWRIFGYGLLAGVRNSTAVLTVHTPDGAQREVEVLRDLSTHPIDWVGRQNINAPSELLEFKWIREGIAYLTLNSFGDEKIVRLFEAIKPKLMSARGVIIDLRQNSGGSTGIGAAILDHFSEHDLIDSLSRTRRSTATERAWGQFGGEHSLHWGGDTWVEIKSERIPVSQQPKILAPTAVLTSRSTVSAAEDFLVLAEPIPHFTRIGEPTCGTTGQPLAFDLPGGGVGFVVTKHDTYPDGREFVGPGIQPDILVNPAVDDIANGVDTVLEKALQWVKERSS